MNKITLNNNDKLSLQNILSIMNKVQNIESSTNNLRRQFDFLTEIDTPLGTDGLTGKMKDNSLIACFAGSNEFTDWLINFAKKAGKDGLHDGFKAASHLALLYAQEFWFNQAARISPKENLKFLKEVVKGSEFKNIYLGGYSNGAAIATLMAGYLANAGFDVILATWGQPKIANFSSYTQKVSKYYRIYHPLDPVIRVPLGMCYQENSIDIITGGNHWFPHNFKQYSNETRKILES